MGAGSDDELMTGSVNQAGCGIQTESKSFPIRHFVFDTILKGFCLRYAGIFFVLSQRCLDSYAIVCHENTDNMLLLGVISDYNSIVFS